jgi:hypothetical protein
MAGVSSRSLTPWQWTEQRAKAAALLARGLSAAEVARTVGMTREGLFKWRRQPAFRARVASLVRRRAGIPEQFAAAHNVHRVKSLQQRWDKLHQIIAERGAAPEMKNVPGGTTGLLVQRIKSIGSGKSVREMREFEIDTGLLTSLLAIERRIAEELGQWSKPKDEKGGEANFNLQINLDSYMATRERAKTGGSGTMTI